MSVRNGQEVLYFRRMRTQYDLITIGDATIDTFLFIDDALVNCSLNKEQCLLCVNYADKLPVQKIHRTVAGNAANNAIGSARLGLKTAFVTTLGDDGSGEWIFSKLQHERVDTKFVRLNKKLETNSSTVLSYKGERTIFVYHAPREYALPPRLAKPRAVYYTSVGEHHVAYNRQIAAFVRRAGALLAFNPGTYQLRAGKKALAPVLAQTNFLFVNKEEAARLVGVRDDVRGYLVALHALGPQVVVVTDGPNGAYVFDGGSGKTYFVGIPHTPVVERTGAGDAFAAGFVSAQLHGKSLCEAMCWGVMNASSVIMHVGPQHGLLTRAGLHAFHKKYHHACAREL